MGFQKKKVGWVWAIRSRKDIVTSRAMIKIVTILLCLWIIFFVAKWAFAMLGVAGKTLWQWVTKIASQQLGEPMIKDEYGNINILVTWFAWEEERWGLLMDTIMLLSYNPRQGTVTFLSVPRDLYVAYDNGVAGRVNGHYWSAYLEADNNYEAGAESLMKKVSQITGVEIPYYATINFDGFVWFIDLLWGIEIDVPYTLIDDQYPDGEDGYEIFSVQQGIQQFDWARALKYARSRQTTSDFSRALRQQHIIEAIVEKITWMMTTAKIGKLQELFEETKNVYRSNITYKQMLGMTEYLDDDRWYFSFVYTADCDMRYIDLTEPGCYLRYGDRQAFGGAAVLIPEGAGPTNLSYYKKTQDFAFWVVHNQEFLKEWASIRILNWIDTDAARAQGYRINGVATVLGQELILKGFGIKKVINAPENHSNTFLAVPWTGSYVETVDALASFVDYTEVVVDQSYWLSGVTVILWDDYLKNL